MAYKFKNYSGKNKFTGEFNYGSEIYEYSLYLPDFNSSLRTEIVDYFGNRMQNGKTCLDVDKKVVEEYIDNGDVSAFIIINKKGSDEKASGTLQIYDWCSGNKKQSLDNAHVWINDLCRISGISGVKTQAVIALTYFMEQLTVQNLGKTYIYLFVDADDPKNKSGLMSLYSAKYGFTLNSEINPSVCPFNGTGLNVIAMKKANLVSDINNIDFKFLRKRSPGGGSKSKRTKKRKGRKTKKTSKN
jgi:hypothetical protein